MTRVGHPGILKSVFALLLLNIFVHVWAAVTNLPLPVGRPSAVVAALTVAVTAVYIAHRRDFAVDRQTSLALAVAFCLLLWAAISTWINDQYPSHITRLGQTAMGIAMLWVVSMTIHTLPRIRIVTFAIVVATFVSALVGIAILAQGEPFLSLWLWIAHVSEANVKMALDGRTAGMSVGTSIFSYHLAVAIPLAVGLLLISPFRLFLTPSSTGYDTTSSPGKTLLDDWIWRGALIVILTGLTTGLVLNATRSALLGVTCGVLVALSPLLLNPFRGRRIPILLSLAVVAVATFVIVSVIEERWTFNPRIVSVQDTSAQSRVPMAITAVRYAVEYPLGTVVYDPEPRHLPSGLDPAMQRQVLSLSPHNQFLAVLAYYGWPGFILILLFYGFLLSVFVSMIRLALDLRTAWATVLVAALAGCMGAYFCNSMFQPTGPFVADWHHWIVIGLVFSAHAVLKREGAVKRRL